MIPSFLAFSPILYLMSSPLTSTWLGDRRFEFSDATVAGFTLRGQRDTLEVVVGVDLSLGGDAQIGDAVCGLGRWIP